MKKLLASRWFWPGICMPFLVTGIAMLVGRTRPGVIGGLALVAAWCLTIPFGRAQDAVSREATPRAHLAVAGWGLLVVVVLVSGLGVAMSFDPMS